MKRKRWKARLVGGLLGLAALGGCKQQLFLEPADYQDAVEAGPKARLKLLEEGPADPIVPMSIVAPGANPATVLDPARPPRFVTLKELIAVALEQGNIGGQAINNAGFTSDQLPNFQGRGSSGTDAIVAFAYDPAIAGAEVERALSKFDARWISSLTWNKNDAPTLSLQQSFSNGDTATLQSSLVKPLPTGGVSAITFSTTYQNLSNPPPASSGFVTLTTSYTPRIQFSFEQPLLQGFGVEINQLLPSHPGSQLLNLRPSGGSGSEGILITRTRLEQQRAQFDAFINFMLLNVETAYWNLYSAYYNLAAQEEGLKQSLEGYLYFAARAEAGAARPQQAFQARAQFELFRAQVAQARSDVLTQERNLRGLLGMRSDDGTRLIPVDEPTLVPYEPNYAEAANEAIQNRPELLIQRQELKAQQLNIVLQRNLRRPDLRFVSTYDVAGLGPRLDGDTAETNAFRNFTSNRFNSWQLGFRLDMPIGFRDANALVRQAQLNMRKTYFQLLDAERKTQEIVIDQIRQVQVSQELIRHRRAQRANLERALELDRMIREQGAAGRGPEDAASFIANLLQQQRDLAAATAQEFQAIANYNIALAKLEAAKGTIQRYNNVMVADGPMPQHVVKRAADHFKAREVAIKLREQPSDTVAPCVPPNWSPLADKEVEAKAAEMDMHLLKPGTPAPATGQPWMPGQVVPPAPKPLNPAETAPAPQPARPMPPSGPPLGASTPLPMPQPNGAPAFTPVDTLKLPRRSTGPAIADSTPPVAPPTTPMPLPTIPLPGTPAGSGTGVPIGVTPAPR